MAGGKYEDAGVTWVLLLALAIGTFEPSSIAYCQDTVVVRAVNEPLWGGKVDLVEELRIGKIDGPDEYVLAQPQVVTADGHGDIFVFDRSEPVIRHYDSDGQHIRDIGRGGEGPGEYRDVRAMHVFEDGRLLIWDISNARATFYDSSGSYLESHAHHDLGSSGSGDIFFGVDTSGAYFVERVDRTRDVRMYADGHREQPTALYRITPPTE